QHPDRGRALGAARRQHLDRIGLEDKAERLVQPVLRRAPKGRPPLPHPAARENPPPTRQPRPRAVPRPSPPTPPPPPPPLHPVPPAHSQRPAAARRPQPAPAQQVGVGLMVRPWPRGAVPVRR